MNFVSRILAISLLAAFLAGCAGSQEQSSQEGSATAPTTTGESTTASAEDATSRTVAAAESFLAILDDGQREQVSYAFDSDRKSNWTNLPVGDAERNGVVFGDITEEQQQAAMAIFEAAMSQEGYEKTVGIMNGD